MIGHVALDKISKKPISIFHTAFLSISQAVFTRVSRYVPWIKDILAGGSGLEADPDIALAEGKGAAGRCTMKTPACYSWKDDGKCK